METVYLSSPIASRVDRLTAINVHLELASGCAKQVSLSTPVAVTVRLQSTIDLEEE